MNFITERLPRACAVAQQVVTSFPGTPVSILQRGEKRWELVVGPEALNHVRLVPGQNNGGLYVPTWEWPSDEREQLVAGVLAGARALESADATR